ncbi:SusC/RagA family TonB-linked outer membrane protein [Rhodohalobacter sp. SW132]|uniref:SusC/RagA family TonB-linked outer membrane protein n=1 Tax=Rhodohalobacter sp. SW132 TaxID=2293433 RepID=UPI000E21E644|nr:SusC/RagA family TonB-linked outer membrane protein [Rhodohalobacter sp. SW132]REL39084.1 SusC/RagA family TonB-linked outer membrane protein [Rhodohalobacter sp. SW132]
MKLDTESIIHQRFRLFLLSLSAVFVLSIMAHEEVSGQDYAYNSGTGSNFVPISWYNHPGTQSVYKEKIDLQLRSATYQQALNRIATEGKIRLSYDSGDLPEGRLTMVMKDVTIIDAFRELVNGTGLEALASPGGQVVVKRTNAPLTIPKEDQSEEVTGVVYDGQTGSTLPGVNILVRGTTIGTSTNVDGEFSLNVPSLSDTLVASYIGYQELIVPISGRSQIDLTLTPMALVGDEIVVVGYGNLRRQDVTGSISSVRSDDLDKSITSSFDSALQGRAAGVMVMTNSGQPGGGVSVRIRGTNSLTGDAEPLYVIDGIPVSAQTGDGTNALATLNPNDIESIDILKDASAAAIYGARAANGVVLVTTKRGTAGETHVDYNAYVGFQQLPGRIDVMNLPEYAEYRNRQAELVGFGERAEFQDPSILGDGTNWQDELFQTAPMQNHTLAISGGDVNTRYRLSAGYFGQDGIATGSNFNRYSARLNLDNNPTRWLQVGTSLNLSRADERLTVSEADLVNLAIRQSPDIPVRSPDGSWGGPTQSEFTLENPVAMAQIVDDTRHRREVLGNIYADINFLDNLSLRSELNVSYNFTNRNQFTPTYEFNARTNELNESSRSRSNSEYWQSKTYMTYVQPFGEQLSMNAVLGHEIEVFEFEGLSGSRQNFPGNNIQELAAGDAATAGNNSWAGSNSMQSLFSRVNLNYGDRYMLTGTIRADASSRFGSENRWGYFPSFAAAWRIANEPFFNIDLVNELRLRGGYGFVGNQNIGNYLFGSALNVTATRWGSGVRPANIANPALRWESTESINLGLDVTILNDRISLTTDVYQKWTNDLLLRQPLPLYAGTSGTGAIGAPTVNIGSLENRGIEIALNTVNVNRNLRWESTFIYSMNRNKVTEMDQSTSFIERQINFFDPVSRTIVGQPVGQFYGYVVDGVFEDAEDIQNHAQQNNNVHPTQGVWAGDLKFRDLNGDGIIDEQDRTVIGDPNPDFQFGITNNFYFRNFDLSVFINGSYGNDIFNQVKRQNEDPSSNFGLLASVNEHARIELIDPAGSPNDITNVRVTNPGTTVPRITSSDPNNNQRISDRFVEDGSYMRLKNLTVGYTLPVGLLSRYNMRTVRLYFSGENLFTITGYSGYDPEVGSQIQDPLLIGVDNGRYPSQRIFTFGINIGL